MVQELETIMTQKGQVTIPHAVRKRLGLKPRDRVRFEVEGDVVKLTRASSRILAGYGAAMPRRRPEDFRSVRGEIEQAIAAEVVAETKGS